MAAIRWIGRLAALAGIAAIAATAGPLEPLLRGAVAVALALFLPGLLLLRLAGQRRLDAETLLLAAGLSLALTIVLGLGLDDVQRLDGAGWAIALGGIVAALTVATGLQRLVAARNADRDAAWDAARRASWNATWDAPQGASSDALAAAPVRRLRPSYVIAAVAALGLAGGAIGLARHGAASHRQFAYSELWLLPSDGRDLSLVTLGIRNQEQNDTSYDVDLMLDGAIIAHLEGIRLATGDAWTQDLPVAMADVTSDHRIEAWLYREGYRAVIYRRAWLSVKASHPNLDAKDVDAKDVDAKNGGAKNVDAKSGGAKNVDAKNGGAKNGGAKNVDAKNVDAQHVAAQNVAAE